MAKELPFFLFGAPPCRVLLTGAGGQDTDGFMSPPFARRTAAEPLHVLLFAPAAALPHFLLHLHRTGIRGKGAPPLPSVSRPPCASAGRPATAIVSRPPAVRFAALAQRARAVSAAVSAGNALSPSVEGVPSPAGFDVTGQ